jgi:hypothetical protein
MSFEQELDDGRRVLLIQCAGRLVGEDHRWPVHNRPGNGRSLTLAAGELIGESCPELAQSQPLEQVRGPALCMIGVGAQGELKANVLRNREERQQVVRLVHDSDRVFSERHPAGLGK